MTGFNQPSYTPPSALREGIGTVPRCAFLGESRLRCTFAVELDQHGR